MRMPQEGLIVEVGPRDGLQNMGRYIETDKKVDLINALSNTGLKVIEVTSFVHPRTVPQLKDAKEVMSRIQRKKGVSYRVLIPNLTGAQRAVEAGSKHMNFVLAASETFNKNNVRRTIGESLEEFRRIVDFIQKRNVETVSVSLSTAFGCPFEKKVPREKVVDIARRLTKLGATELILCDTTGMANPLYVTEVLGDICEKITGVNIAAHFHNTRGTGLANIFAALSVGINIIETCVGGLGGCPFAPGANANVPTEDTVNMLQDMGIRTGVNLVDLIACAEMAQEMMGKELPGQVMKSGPTYG